MSCPHTQSYTSYLHSFCHTFGNLKVWELLVYSLVLSVSKFWKILLYTDYVLLSILNSIFILHSNKAQILYSPFSLLWTQPTRADQRNGNFQTNKNSGSPDVYLMSFLLCNNNRQYSEDVLPGKKIIVKYFWQENKAFK